jgi:hypothetical protein
MNKFLLWVITASAIFTGTILTGCVHTVTKEAPATPMLPASPILPTVPQ